MHNNVYTLLFMYVCYKHHSYESCIELDLLKQKIKSSFHVKCYNLLFIYLNFDFCKPEHNRIQQ